VSGRDHRLSVRNNNAINPKKWSLLKYKKQVQKNNMALQ
jgi:hypothetical protein